MENMGIFDFYAKNFLSPILAVFRLNNHIYCCFLAKNIYYKSVSNY